jgi:NADH-quinone oxidoreductase subunit J
MTAEDFVFGICAVVTVVSALLVVTRRNPVYSAFWLLPVFLALAIIFVMLLAPFMAAMQVLVYGGAIIVVFLFVIMLLNLGPEDLVSEGGIGRYVAGFGIAAVLVALLSVPIVLTFTPDGDAPRGRIEFAPDAEPQSYELPTVAGATINSQDLFDGLPYMGEYSAGRLSVEVDVSQNVILYDDGHGAFVPIYGAGYDGPEVTDSSVKPNGHFTVTFDRPLQHADAVVKLHVLPPAFGGLAAEFGSPQAVAGAMFSNWVVPFELAAVLLLVGIMGALLLSKNQLRRLRLGSSGAPKHDVELTKEADHV